MQYRIGIDFGGTGIKVGIVDENYNIVQKHTRPTGAQRGFEVVAADMADAAKTCAEQAGMSITDFSGIGIGTPGFAIPSTGMLSYSPNTNWVDVPLAQVIAKHTGVATRINNDANCAIWGERLAGAAKGYDEVIMLTLGTGIGGGMVLNGKLFGGGDGMGVEMGHTVFIHGGERCGCNKLGCFEAYASVTGLIRQTKRAMEISPDSLMWKLCGGDIQAVEGKTSFDAAKQGDATALEVVEQYTDYVAAGIASFVNVYRPQIVIIGGGVCNAGDFLMDRLNEKSAKYTHCCAQIGKPDIIRAALGNDAGIIGAAFLE